MCRRGTGRGRKRIIRWLLCVRSLFKQRFYGRGLYLGSVYTSAVSDFTPWRACGYKISHDSVKITLFQGKKCYFRIYGFASEISFLIVTHPRVLGQSSSAVLEGSYAPGLLDQHVF